MSDPLIIPRAERGKLRLFALDMRPEEVAFLQEPGALCDVFGAKDLDEGRIQIVRISDLDDLGLSGFLREGCEISEDELAAHAQALAAVSGAVVLLPSTAAPGGGTLHPDVRLRYLLTLTETGPDWRAGGPIETASAAPYSAPRPSPRDMRRQATVIGGSIFFFVLAGIIAFVWWIVT